MNGQKIRDFIRGTPFSPFDIKTSDGRVYTVDHPEFVSVSRDFRLVIYQTLEDDHTIWIDTAQIVALEQANRPSAA